MYIKWWNMLNTIFYNLRSQNVILTNYCVHYEFNHFILEDSIQYLYDHDAFIGILQILFISYLCRKLHFILRFFVKFFLVLELTSCSALLL